MMKNILILLIVIIPISAKSQEFDSLKVKYDFIFGYKYSVYGIKYRNVSPFMSGGSFSLTFKNLFDRDSEEYQQLISSENINKINEKYIAILVGVPLGLALANSLSNDPFWDKKHDIKLALTSAVFSGVGYYLEKKGFKMLQTAVKMRNSRINKTVLY